MKSAPTIKALVFDLDGTAIPNDFTGMPSNRVIEAVQQAKELCHVSIATGRPYHQCQHILDALQIDGICIISGGTELYSRSEDQRIWKQELDAVTVQQMVHVFKEYSHYEMADETSIERAAVHDFDFSQPASIYYFFEITEQDKNQILEQLKSISGISVHVMASWKKGLFDIHISHELANKKHALQSLLARLNIDHDNCMVVGDGGNDIPLFELAGWKVAMGNAAQELKDQADWIAPHVDDDGLAVAIEKFILS